MLMLIECLRKRAPQFLEEKVDEDEGKYEHTTLIGNYPGGLFLSKK